MKRIIAIAACLLASLAAAGTASAQDHAAKANIPFGFYVGNTWLPAGTYTLTSDAGNPAEIFIHNGDGKVSMLTLGHADDNQPAGTHKLVFKKYGDQYFLHEVLCSSCRMNIAFSESKREKKAEKLEATNEAPKDVYLALLK
jgi:hypothetical protein